MREHLMTVLDPKGNTCILLEMVPLEKQLLRF